MKLRSFIFRINSWFVFVLLTLVTVVIVVASFFLVDYLRKEEIKRIDLFVKAIKFQQDVVAPDPQVQDLVLEIYRSNNSIPVVITDNHGQPLDSRNLPEDIASDSKKLAAYAASIGKNYPPVEIKFPDGNNQYVYYDNSRLLNNLRYSPYLLGLFIFAYLMFSFWFMRTVKKTDEGFVWAGLAKETAHQIGTPLSSMIGWIEIMKMENPGMMAAREIEKDVSRLKTISERFSKIGSVPELNDYNIRETIQQNFDYLKSRISTKVNFSLAMPEQEILVPHNRILFSWVIENMVKNAVDAMKGVGKMDIILSEKGQNIYIDFRDTGCGMTSQQMRNVFKPGYSTKKRGWGLGLSLAKRVIKEYHNGDLRILQSEPGKGTTFRIILKVPKYHDAKN